MGNIIESKVDNPSLIYHDFIKDLDNFINESCRNLKALQNENKKMGNYWAGQQYKTFSVVIEKSIQDCAKELKELRELKEKLVVKEAQLRAGTGNK